ncbi:uncharacterized protein BP01DRAFT_397112 [Aspergillus saccharolyticus JOP 1030-1]|uniref:Aminoglycoside phosphotransferase domain-containing protein n=1 Tax=Aspergillus saccharolyticus JOP 1030-1 TaxID=1450539 RepID=A0A319AIU4_9EURO|nr:hypothetical protein BP01DRAFT_397112 [Aspergillus saccharolyticus JOP 1030-1]PYH46592.1 hypothetical protein BP01DRAFT_397112 [Aspergillus saccharolyticus JOP 1030-1]
MDVTLSELLETFKVRAPLLNLPFLRSTTSLNIFYPARFNAHTLTKLQAAIEKDSETDLTVKLPLRYSAHLSSICQNAHADPENATVIKGHREDDIYASICSIDLAEIVFPLLDMSHYLAQRLINLIDISKVVWKGFFARKKMVLSCGYNIIFKAHKPSIAAPKPLDLTTLAELILIMNNLRYLPYDIGTFFGGAGSEVFADLLRQLFPSTYSPLPVIISMHGDLRPKNITMNGFYPEYYEAIRCTKCMAPYEENDWFLFIPDCISPRRYMHWWLFDRARQVRVI